MKSIYWNDDYRESAIREIYIEPDKTLTIVAEASYDEDNDSINIKINFCPICGRKLSGDNE
jgi:hypothetical protein